VNTENQQVNIGILQERSMPSRRRERHLDRIELHDGCVRFLENQVNIQTFLNFALRFSFSHRFERVKERQPSTVRHVQ
jgi:hypothetical protein